MAARKPNAAYLKKAPTAVHSGFAEYIEKTTGHVVPIGDVALVQRLYPLYLKSPAVVKARDAEKAARDAEAAVKKAAKDAKLRERLAQIEEQRRDVLTKLGIDPEFEVSGDPDEDGDVDGDVTLSLVEDENEDLPSGPAVLESADEFEVLEPEPVEGEPAVVSAEDPDAELWDADGEEDW